MLEFLNQWIPNVVDKPGEFLTAWVDTFIMLVISTVFVMIFGIAIGVVTTLTKEDGILPNRIVYKILDSLINAFRSIPFIILLILVMPLSRIILKTGIGVKGALIPLIVVATPFYARQVENALAELPKGRIEAAEAIGLSPFEIVVHVYLKESFAPLVRATVLTLINLLGVIAMTGSIGAGGIGDFAIRYGHARNQTDVTWTIVILLILLVSLIQAIGNFIIRRSRRGKV